MAGLSPAAETTGTTAVRATDFLDSIGTQSAISVRGENLQKTIACAQYLGARWFRGGVEGDVPIEQFIELHKQAGLRFSWGLGSGGTNIQKLIETGRQMATAGALLAYCLAYWPAHWSGEALVTIGLPMLAWGWTLFFLSTWQLAHHEDEENPPPARKRLGLSRPSWPSRPSAWPTRTGQRRP